MKLLRLAVRNLLRHKRRTLMSTGAIVVGVFYLIVGKAFVAGISEAIVEGAENGLGSHIQIRIADYPTVGKSMPVDELVALSPEARALVDERAQAVTERTMFSVTVATGADSMRVRGIGYDPATDEAVIERTTWKLEDRPDGTPTTVPETAEEGAMLGVFLARLLEVEAGDRLIVQTRTHPGAINALEIPVGAVLNAGHTQLDQSIFLPKPLVDELVRNPDPTHVLMRLEDRDEATAIAAALAPLLGDAYETRTWIEETAELLALQQIRYRALDILVGVLLIMSSFAIANTILMAAYERVREIGTLRAMGMSKRGVLTLFLLEGGIMGAAAGGLGALIGGGLAWYLSQNPVDFGEMAVEQGSANIPFNTYLYAQFDMVDVLAPVLVSLAVALLASLYPARVASNMVIADAVRAE